MVTVPRPKSPTLGEPAMGSSRVLVSVNVMQLGPVRQGGSHGLWQQGSWVGRVTGVVPSVGSKAGVVEAGIGVLISLFSLRRSWNFGLGGGRHWAQFHEPSRNSVGE